MKEQKSKQEIINIALETMFKCVNTLFEEHTADFPEYTEDELDIMKQGYTLGLVDSLLYKGRDKTIKKFK